MVGRKNRGGDIAYNGFKKKRGKKKQMVGGEGGCGTHFAGEKKRPLLQDKRGGRNRSLRKKKTRDRPALLGQSRGERKKAAGYRGKEGKEEGVSLKRKKNEARTAFVEAKRKKKEFPEKRTEEKSRRRRKEGGEKKGKGRWYRRHLGEKNLGKLFTVLPARKGEEKIRTDPAGEGNPHWLSSLERKKESIEIVKLARGGEKKKRGCCFSQNKESSAYSQRKGKESGVACESGKKKKKERKGKEILKSFR